MKTYGMIVSAGALLLLCGLAEAATFSESFENRANIRAGGGALTCRDAPQFVPGVSGNGVLFKTDDTRPGVRYLAAERLSKDAFTIEFWVRPAKDYSAMRASEITYFRHWQRKDKLFVNRIHLLKRGTVDYLILMVSNGEGKFVGGNWLAVKTADLDWKAGGWHHIAIAGSREAKKVILYLDGKPAAAASGETFPDELVKYFVVGCAPGDTLDELTMTDRMKTAAEITAVVGRMKP